ncbi:putative membrane protein [Methanocalculus alkaliphilus]|uniref:DUF2206 domain-containing protein n=1 Tax=Methanocalculus alkaliphilus TaxID=768730 RepID=UPI0020A0A04E|nr:DUF2206 domain-containing protein [Methanocalculus alkaliphilus]MCP1716120.1 putative membrane protein [Methanocalculus alkaliphilus]
MALINPKYQQAYLLTTILVISSTYIFFDVPYLSFIFGFLFILVLPGLIILPILNIQNINIFEKFFLIVGISVSFSYIYGFLINHSLPLMGFQEPLSTKCIWVTFTTAYIILIIIGVKNNYYKFSSCLIPRFKSMDKILLSFLILIPAAIFFSVHRLSVTGSNTLIIGALLTIPVYLLILTLYKDTINDSIFPLSLFVISFSLLSMVMLRFPYIFGSDVQREYGLHFLTVYENAQWTFLGGNLGLSLSISLLPTIIFSICAIQQTELLFKFIYVFICSLSPLVIYYSIKQYLGSFLSLFASFFFTSQYYTIISSAAPRTNLAIFFCALIIYIATNKNIDHTGKNFFYVVFIISIVLTHYTTAYIFLAIFSIWILYAHFLYQRTDTYDKVSLGLIAFYIIFLLSWTFLLFRGGVFITLVEVVSESFHQYLFSANAHDTLDLRGKEMLFSPTFRVAFLSAIHWLTVWACLLSIGIGTLVSMLFLFIRTPGKLDSLVKNKPLSPFPTIRGEYIICAFFCITILGSIVFVPQINAVYGYVRLFPLTLIFTSPFLILGVLYTFRILSFIIDKPNRFNYKCVATTCLLLMIISYYLFSFGIPYQIVGTSDNVFTSNESTEYLQTKISENEKYAALWLKENFNENTNIIRPVSRQTKELWSIGRFPLSTIRRQDHDYFYVYFGNYEILNDLDAIFLNINNQRELSKVFTNKKVYIYYGNNIIYPTFGSKTENTQN